LAFNLHSLTNGAQGLVMPLPPFPNATFERPFYLAMVAVLALSVLCSWYVSTGRLGLMLCAIRDDEDRARGLGVHTTYAKLFAVAISAGLTAMAGGVWAYYIGFIYPQFAVDPLVTIGAVLMAFLGGRGRSGGRRSARSSSSPPSSTWRSARARASSTWWRTRPSSSGSCCSCRAGSCRPSPTSSPRGARPTAPTAPTGRGPRCRRRSRERRARG